MIIRRAFAVAFVLIMAVAYLPETRRAASQPTPPLVIIVGSNLGANSIGLGVLRNVYEGYPTDFQGRRLIPFHHPTEASTRARFDRAVLGLTPDQAARFWIDQRVRRGVQPPRSIASPELMMKVVASLPGAIGYVEIDPKIVPSQLKVLAVDGGHPGAVNYPL